MSAKAAVSSLLLAIKMFSLYAEDHSHCQKAVFRLQKDIETYLNTRGDLTLSVEKNRLSLGDLPVYQGSEKDGDLAFALFRDGILRLSFLKGLEQDETIAFVRILDKYKSLSNVAEGDIVTALWEQELPHIQYEAVDNILELGQNGNITLPDDEILASVAVPLGGLENSEGFTPMDIHVAVEASLHEAFGIKELPITSESSLQITIEEAGLLEEMVNREEQRDATQEILDMMAAILKEPQDEEFFSYILAYMVEELDNAFRNKDFDVALKILTNLNLIRRTSQESSPWAVPKIRQFLLKIAESDFLSSVKEHWVNLSETQLEKAKEVLMFLPPDAILPLGSMIQEVPAPIQNILFEIIIALAARDPKPFEVLIEASEESLVYRFVSLLAKAQDKKSSQVLTKLIHHSSERVRREALKAFIIRKLWVPEELVSLLDDESDFIRQLAVRYLGSRKSEEAERRLLLYLRKMKGQNSNGKEMIALFSALGKCGIGQSIPYLRETLLKGGWISRFRESPLRQGAAAALKYLDKEESREILQKAFRSPFPGIRSAAQTAFGEDAL